MQRDGFNKSVWQACPDYRSVNEHEPGSFKDIFDVIIVGGGITGITTALLLQSAADSDVTRFCQSMQILKLQWWSNYFHVVVGKYFSSLSWCWWRSEVADCSKKIFHFA